MKWFFIIFINILCTCVISALDEDYKKRIENFYNNEKWTQKGFSTLEAMLKDYLATHPAIEPCKNLIILYKDYFTETLNCTSRREIYTPENGAMVTLDGLTYLSVPSMFRCFCLNPEHDFFILPTEHYGRTNIRLEKIYPDGIKDNQTAYSHWFIYTQKAIRQTYEGSDGYNQMADWYKKKIHDNMNFTCQSFPYISRNKLERSDISLADAFVRVDRNEPIKIPGHLCCVFISFSNSIHPLDHYFIAPPPTLNTTLVYHFIATRPIFKWTRVILSKHKFNDTTTFNIDY